MEFVRFLGVVHAILVGELEEEIEVSAGSQMRMVNGRLRHHFEAIEER